MTAPAETRPPAAYRIEASEVVAATAELRVLRQVLAPADSVPWHRHSRITDRFFCLEGSVTVETRAPDAVHVLRPADRCEVSPGVAHRVRNAGPGRAQLLLVQGPGPYDFLPISGEPGAAA
jgi:quercetin dioxygenase-like cupin family protein